MRVIAGKYKGRQLKSLEGEEVRPTLDRVKEAVFSILQWRVVDSVFVDLFSGSGGIGIEALSRGAKKVYFSENNEKTFKIIRENLEKVAEQKSGYKFMSGDYKKNLAKIEELADIIYADPPYDSIATYEALPSLAYDYLADDGLLILEYSKSMLIKTDGYEVISDKKYGIVKILVLKKIKTEEIKG